MIAGIDAPIWAARLCADEAEVRGNRGAAGDRELAAALVDRAINDARRLGAGGIERRAVALEQHLRALDALGGVLPAQPAAQQVGVAPPALPARDPVAELVCEGDVWRINHAGTEFRLSDSRGIRHLSRLLAQPGFAYSAIELVAGAPGLARPSATAAGLTVHGGDDGVGPALDDHAKNAYRERIEQLRSEFDEAESFNDPERAARLRDELDFVASELASAVGLGGRDRPHAADGERARVSVTRAIRRAISRIGEHDPPLAHELDSAVRTGALCVYEPPPHLRLQWRVELPEA